MQLANKKMVVTGAAGGLGSVVAEVAKSQAAEVVLLDVVPEFTSSLGAAYTVDLTDAAQVSACFSQIGDFDIVANIAGGFAMGPTVAVTEDAFWDQLFMLNVTTLRRVLAAAVPALIARGRGSIVNVGAVGAARGAANMSAYVAAKATVMRLTESVSEEVRGAGVNCNAVLPSVIDTPANRDGMPDADFDAWVSPRDLAEVICFLGSDAARAVHGALVPVTGLV